MRTISEVRDMNIAAYSSECTLMSLGLLAPVITRSQAVKTYGSWFTRALNEGRIQPCRRGEGKTGTMYFSVADLRHLLALDCDTRNITLKEVQQF